jgi:hypothetical protein
VLADSRLISATEEMNRISDDIRNAADKVAQMDAETVQSARTKWARDADLPIGDLATLAKVAAWAELRHAVNGGAQPKRTPERNRGR